MSEEAYNDIGFDSMLNIMKFDVLLKSGEKVMVLVRRSEHGSDYGNHSKVVVDINSHRYAIFDTRYNSNCGTVGKYRDYFRKWVYNNWEDNASSITEYFNF